MFDYSKYWDDMETFNIPEEDIAAMKRFVELKEPVVPMHVRIPDIVLVTRCKNCVHYNPYEKPVEDFDGYCIVRQCETDENEFCSYGKEQDGCYLGDEE